MNRHPYIEQRPLPAGTALAIILACGIGLAFCWALVGWMLCSQAAEVAACTLAAPALPLQGRLRRLRALGLRLRRWWLARQVEETQRQISQYKRLMWDDALKLEDLRNQLAEQQRQQLRLASRR